MTYAPCSYLFKVRRTHESLDLRDHALLVESLAPRIMLVIINSTLSVRVDRLQFRDCPSVTTNNNTLLTFYDVQFMPGAAKRGPIIAIVSGRW